MLITKSFVVKGCEKFLSFYSDRAESVWLVNPLIGKLAQGPPFWDIRMRAFCLIPLFRDIEITITAPIFFDILASVSTWADDVFVLFTVSGGQPAGTAHIAIAFFIEKEGLKQVEDPLLVFAEKVSFGLLDLF